MVGKQAIDVLLPPDVNPKDIEYWYIHDVYIAGYPPYCSGQLCYAYFDNLINVRCGVIC